MWSTKTDDELIAAAERRINRGALLPVDLVAELALRGIEAPTPDETEEEDDE